MNMSINAIYDFNKFYIRISHLLCIFILVKFRSISLLFILLQLRFSTQLSAQVQNLISYTIKNSMRDMKINALGVTAYQNGNRVHITLLRAFSLHFC